MSYNDLQKYNRGLVQFLAFYDAESADLCDGFSAEPLLSPHAKRALWSKNPGI